MPAVNLRCGQCNYENEAERVYCHNCGAKLDRTVLPEAEDDKRHESPDRAQRRIKKMTNPSGNPVAREFKALLSTLTWGAIVAAVILMSRQPDNVPDTKGLMVDRFVPSELSQAFEATTPQTVKFSQDEINYALKQSLKGKDSGLIPGIQFSRAFVNLHPGAVRVTTQQSLWGYPFYSSETYKVGMKDGKFAPVLVAGSFGRLPVDARLMQHVDFSFRQLWPALKRERGYLDKLQDISSEKGQLTLVTKGAAAAPR